MPPRTIDTTPTDVTPREVVTARHEHDRARERRIARISRRTRGRRAA
jgi:hypothetical protein